MARTDPRLPAAYARGVRDRHGRGALVLAAAAALDENEFTVPQLGLGTFSMPRSLVTGDRTLRRITTATYAFTDPRMRAFVRLMTGWPDVR